MPINNDVKHKKYKNGSIRLYIANLFFILLSISLLSVSFAMQYGHINFKSDIIRIGDSLSITLQTTELGSIFAVLISTLYFCSLIYCFGYNKDYNDTAKIRFNTLYALSVIIAFLISLSADLFTIFIFYETLTLSTYPLICFKKTRESVLSARRYLVYLITPSFLLLMPGIMYIYHKCGHIDFISGGILGGHGLNAIDKEILYLVIVYGIGKIALFPLYNWLPIAMVASVPVSGLLHAVAVVKSGIFVLLRVTYDIFGAHTLHNVIELFFGYNWLMWLGTIGVITSSLLAFRTYNIKKRLAYSTISHLSIIITIIASFNDNAIKLAMYYAFCHGIAKILLFYANGIIYKSTHKTTVLDINGLGQAASFGFTTFLIGVLAIIGIHGFALCNIKHAIVHFAFDNHHNLIVFNIAFSMLTSALYLGKIPYYAFVKENVQNHATYKVDFRMKAAVLIIIALNVIYYLK